MAACSNSSTTASTAAKDPAASAANATPAATSGAAPTPTTTAAAPYGPVDPCKIVSTDEIAAAFGGTVAAGVVNADNGGCDFEITGQTNTGDSGILTQVSIELTDSYEPYAKTKVVVPDIIKIDDLGREAWYYSLANQLHIDLGGRELLISGLFPGDKAAIQAEVIAFGHTVVGKL
jgi:Protein of unknown function (DUF3558)